MNTNWKQLFFSFLICLFWKLPFKTIFISSNFYSYSGENEWKIIQSKWFFKPRKRNKTHMSLRHLKWKVFLYTQWPIRDHALRIFMAAYKCAVYLTRQHVFSLLFLVSALLTLNTNKHFTYCTLVRENVDIIINCISSCSFAITGYMTYICMPTIYIRYKLF